MTRRIVSMLFTVCCWTVSAGATVLVPADLTDLTRSARVIARGEVLDVQPRRTEDGGTIETIVTLEPHVYLKGSLGDVVRFRVPGGQLGRLRRVVVGAPQFVPGEQVIVFLDAVSPAVPNVVGLNQGVFRVMRSAAGVPQIVPAPLLRPSAGSTRVVRGDGQRQAMELAVFEREVRSRGQEAR